MKHLKYVCLAAFFTVCITVTLPLDTHAASAASQTSIGSQITPYSDAYEWRYRLINGKLYRRLYNLTKAKWVGDWELCP